MEFNVRLIQDRGSLSSLQAGWRSLVEENRSLSVFALPEWHAAWWNSIGSGRKMFIMTAEKNGRLHGILPLSLRRASWDELKLRILEFSGGGQADYQDLITTERDREGVLQAFRAPFETLCRTVDVVRLHNVTPQAGLSKLIGNPKNLAVIEERSPFLSLSQRKFEEIEKTWKKGHRGDVRRQEKRLQEMGGLTLDLVREKEEIKKLLPSFFRTLKSKWESEGFSPERVLPPAHIRFFTELIDELSERKKIHFSVLRLDGRPISYHYGFFHNDILCWYRPTYEKEFQNYSPGKIHIAKILQRGCEEGWREIDFLSGKEPYKYSWTAEEHSFETLIFSGGGLLGNLGVKWISRWRDFLVRKLRGKG